MDHSVRSQRQVICSVIRGWRRTGDGNGDLVSWRGAVSLFDSILSLRFRCALPLHVVRGIGAAALQLVRCGQPRIQDIVPQSLPLRGTDSFLGMHGARANCGESGSSASAHTKSNTSIDAVCACCHRQCPAPSGCRPSTSMYVPGRVIRRERSIVERRRTLRRLRGVQMFQFGTETRSSQRVVARRGPG